MANAAHLSQSEACSPLGENMPGNIYYASMLQETVQVREVSSEKVKPSGKGTRKRKIDRT